MQKLHLENHMEYFLNGIFIKSNKWIQFHKVLINFRFKFANVFIFMNLKKVNE